MISRLLIESIMSLIMTDCKGGWRNNYLTVEVRQIFLLTSTMVMFSSLTWSAVFIIVPPGLVGFGA